MMDEQLEAQQEPASQRGLLAEKQGTQPAMSGRPQEVSDEMQKSIPTNFQEAFSRVITAGMKVMFSDESHDMMVEQLQKEGDLASNMGTSMASLMALLFQKSNGTMPAEVMIPAGIYLLGQAADFVEQISGEEVTPEIMSNATSAFIEDISAAFKIDLNQVKSATQKLQQEGMK